MEKIKVYSKERCMPCKATVRKLGELAVPHDVIMLEEHPELVEQFVGEGLLSSPVVDTGEERFCGFKPEKLEQIAQEHGYLPIDYS